MSGYRTIARQAKVETIIKKSRFIGSAFPIRTVEEANEILATFRKQMWDANHHCYAYVLGERGEKKKFSDDGEPQGTAGMPILDVIDKKGLTYVLVVVTRYFGGVLLGAGGLVRAYAGACAGALDAAGIRVLLPSACMQLRCDYALWGRVERELYGQDVQLAQTDFAQDVCCTVWAREEAAQSFMAHMVDVCDGRIAIDVVDHGLFEWPAS